MFTRLTPHLGLSERWSLARKRLGSPIVVIFHASIPHGVVLEDELHSAVSILLKTYPILRHGVDDDTHEPSYRFDTSITSSNIIAIDDLGSSTHADLIEAANKKGSTFDIHSGPLLQVELYRSHPYDHLLLYFDHIICDGLGGRNLFGDLLGLLSGAMLQPSTDGLPARLDDTVNLSPDQPKLLTAVCDYPTTVQGYQPLLADPLFSILTLSHGDLQQLIHVGKSHNIPTLQPIFHMASILALYRASAAETLYLRSSTPISERDETKHPRSTGNYVTFHYSTTKVSRSTQFWEEARRFSDTLRHPSARISARTTLGAFSLVCNWDAHLADMVSKANGEERMALAVSNVGRLAVPSSGKLAGQIQDVSFSQSPSAVGGAIVLSIISTEGGPLTVSICSKKGCLEPGILSKFVDNLRLVFRAIIDERVEEILDAF